MSYGPNYNQGQWGSYPPQQGGYQQMYTPANAGYPNPGSSAPYAPPPVPPPASYNNGYGNEKDPYANGRFKPEKKFNDIIFFFLFVGQLLGFAALSGYVLHTYAKEDGLRGGLGSGSTGTRFSLNS
jgi:hypothetical protein